MIFQGFPSYRVNCEVKNCRKSNLFQLPITGTRPGSQEVIVIQGARLVAYLRDDKYHASIISILTHTLIVNYSVVTTSKMKGIKTFNIYNELDVEVTKKMFAKLQELLQNARAKEKTAKDIKLDNYLDPSRQWV